MLTAEPLAPLGVRVTGLVVGAVDADVAEEIAALLAQHGVAVLPGQDVDDDAFLALLASFGDIVFTAGETPVANHPDLNVISNVGRTTPPRSQFHVDTSYVARPPAYTALRAVTVPAAGGETVFASAYLAADTLPADLREAVTGRTVTHVVTGLDTAGLVETAAEHPALARHPRSGREALYLSTPQRCAHVSGMSDDDAAALVARLYAHATDEAGWLRHRWSPGDVVMWDNRAVLHRADHSGVVGTRVMHRGMVTDGRLVAG